jgi:hypothetical protein
VLILISWGFSFPPAGFPKLEGKVRAIPACDRENRGTLSDGFDFE